MAKRNFKLENNWLQALLICLSCILLIGAMAGIFALFKNNEDVSNKDYLVVSYYVKDDLYKKQFYLKGKTINLLDSEKYVWKFEDDTLVDNNYVITENVSLYACPFILTFDCNGSSDVFESKLLYYSETYGELPTPTREGYTFNGWYTSVTGGSKVTTIITMGNTNTIIYAQWSPISYTIKFDGNGATSGSMSNQTFIYGTPLALRTNAYTNGDSKFVGWSTTPDGEVKYLNGASILNLTSTSETITLYAIWTDSFYTARVYEMTTNGTYPSGYKTLTIPAISGNVNLTEDALKSLYVVENGVELDKITDFDGNVITSIEVAEDNSTVVKFYYKRLEHTLTINANGGVISNASDWNISSDNKVATKSFYYKEVYFTLPTPTRDGYTFDGWYTEIDGGSLVTSSDAMETSDITIYAKWIKI